METDGTDDIIFFTRHGREMFKYWISSLIALVWQFVRNCKFLLAPQD